jgi:hypothetical protein
MPTAPAFAYHQPTRPFVPPRAARLPRLRWASALPLALFIAVPIVPLQHGDPGSVAAGIPFAAARGGPDEIQPRPLAGEITPASALAIQPASPFAAQYGDSASALRAETCLTEAIYYEGALEPLAGQRAIAQVVLNRVRHPAYPNSVCGVVFQGQERSTGCQFTFTCDGSRARAPVADLWRRANSVAKAALGGSVATEVGLATHYHADYVMPYWSASLNPAGQIGRHMFYRWRGGAGQAAAFSMPYAGREPLIGAWVPRAASAKAGDALAAGAVTMAGGTIAMPGVATVPGAADAPLPVAAPAPFRARPLLLAGKSADSAP